MNIEMNREERLKMVSAMEFIARQVNDESVFEPWLVSGIADGDIKYGEECEDESYIEDDTFAELMETFLRLMSRAYKSGGLYCDWVVSKNARESEEE